MSKGGLLQQPKIAYSFTKLNKDTYCSYLQEEVALQAGITGHAASQKRLKGSAEDWCTCGRAPATLKGTAPIAVLDWILSPKKPFLQHSSQ
jgi:hypothetical protein